MAKFPQKLAWLGVCGGLLGACTGQIGERDLRDSAGNPLGTVWGTDPDGAGFAGADGSGNGAGGAGGSDSIPDPSAPPLECVTPAVGQTPMRRLTHREYDHAARDLLNLASTPAPTFAADTQVGLFDNTTSAQTVSVLLADQYLVSAEDLANAADIDALLACDPEGADAANCIRGFVERFGRRAYRRPLDAPEVDQLLALHAEHAAASDTRTGVRGVIAAVLASPFFLFRPETGIAPSPLPNARTLSGYEVAARLSALIWASIPDDALLDAAAAGELDDAVGVETHARRMLEDPRSRGALEQFYAQWFGLDMLNAATKDPATYPVFNDALRASMAEETRRYVEHVLWNDDGTLDTLLTADYAIVDSSLAQLYGLQAPATDGSFAQTPLNLAERRGLISQASLMSAFAAPSESSPAKRGKWLRTRILCQDLPDPPNNIPELPEPMEGVSTRDRFAMHTNNDACRGCHDMIDGLGFGLEHYDGIGAYRTMDHGAVVNASGEINATRDIDGAYDGAPELALKLAQSEQVSDCAPTQWFRYMAGRRETADDTCSLVAAREAFATSGGDLRELVVALTVTDAFRSYRAPE